MVWSTVHKHGSPAVFALAGCTAPCRAPLVIRMATIADAGPRVVVRHG